MDLAFGCRRVVFGWEGFGLEFFQNDTCLSLYTYTHTCVIPEGFEVEFFPPKYNPTTSECKVHSVEVDLHYFK